MVAGLLSAIQQFARDSFQSGKTENLGNLTFDELQIRIVSGPNAVIAAAIRGHAPETYNLAMEETLEEVQRLYSSALVNFKGDPEPFRAAESQIARLLETQYREKPADRKRPRAAIIAGAIAALLLLGWVGYSTYLLIEWSRFLTELRKQPGIVVVSYTKDGRTFHVQGFRDPLSEDPKKLVSQAGLDPDRADLQLAPYYSLDDAIVARRATALLHPPAGVTLSAKNGELIPEGSAAQNWIAQLEEKGPWIAGVSKLDESHLQNSNLQHLNTLKGALESIVLLFPLGRAELDAGQETNLTAAAKNIRDLVAQAAPVHQVVIVELVGHTDITGVEAANLPLSRERADNIRAALLRNGVKSASVLPRGVGTSQPLHDDNTEEGRRLNRSVTFKITLSPVPAGAAVTSADAGASSAAPAN
jgi:OOP family OmpA-OmpF porin